MKKLLVNVFVSFLILSIIFQPSSALAISNTGVNEPEPQVLSDIQKQLIPEVPVTTEQPKTDEHILHPEPYLPENRYDSADPYAESLLDPDLPEVVRAHLMEKMEPVDRPAYTPPSPEVVAQTQAQVESFVCNDTMDVPKVECEALVALYSSTNGAGWTNNYNWLVEGSYISTWSGVSIEEGQEGHVVGLDLEANNLRGFIPPELENLTHLKLLALGESNFFGPLPTVFRNMSSLTILFLAMCSFSGPIPAWLGELTNLISLELFMNNFTGYIPVELANLPKLSILTLYDNPLSGEIPSELGNLTTLVRLEIGYSGLNGSIPISFINLTSLETFTFWATQLCEPTSPEFLAWKATVSEWQGTGVVCKEPAPWLLMYYMAGDNNLSAALSYEYSNLVANLQPNVDVAFFYDSSATDSLYRYYPSNGIPETIAKGNLNSGDGLTLSDFMTWAKQKSSAPNVALIIADHGHGLSGVATDDRSDFDQIKVDGEIRNALIASGPVNVIFSHTCLTANLEFMWELRDYTDYYVASESQSWGFEHKYIQSIGENTSARALAKSMAESYFNFRNNAEHPSSISVVDMAYINEMFVKTNDLALAIKQAPISTKLSLWYFLDASVLQRFDEREPDGIDNADRLADLFQFADLVDYFPELLPAAQALLGIEDQFVIYDQAWSGSPKENVEWKHINARGVSIALPLNPMSFYDGEWLDFAAGADWSFTTPTVQASIQVEGYNWGPMVSELIAQNNPEGKDDPLPPDPLSLLVRYEIYLPMLTR